MKFSTNVFFLESFLLCSTALKLTVVMCCVCLVSGTFLNTLKFNVKDCDPTTGEPDTDQGFADEYVVGLLSSSLPLSCEIHSVSVLFFHELVQFLLSQQPNAS